MGRRPRRPRLLRDPAQRRIDETGRVCEAAFCSRSYISNNPDHSQTLKSLHNKITKNAQRLASADEPNAPKQPAIAAMTLKTFASHGVRSDADHHTFLLKKILVPIDFSAASKNAFRCAVRLAEEFAAELTLLYVLAPTSSNHVHGRSARALEKAICKR
jgi:hypothetical protein